MKSQKEAVFEAVRAVKGENSFEGAVELSRDEREQVRKQLFDEFRQGNVSFAGDFGDDDKRMMGYISGLISNWLRKDDRLNGNVKYQPKNPGSRAGNGDESLKAMRALLNATTDGTARKEIQAEIDRRLGELKPKKTINVDALPPHLRKFAQGLEGATGGSDSEEQQHGQGFQNMDKDKLREVAAKGGRHSHGGGGDNESDDSSSGDNRQ